LEAVNLTSLCSAYQIYMCKKDNILRREEQMNQDEAVKSGAFPRMQCLGGIRTYNLPASTAWPGAEFAWEISDAQLVEG